MGDIAAFLEAQPGRAQTQATMTTRKLGYDLGRRIQGMPDSNYVYEIEDIISEINRRAHRRIELFPFWKYPIWAGDQAAFKLRDKRGNLHQIMDLEVPEKNFFSPSAGRKKLTSDAISRITGEIERFFSAELTKTQKPVFNFSRRE